jgi:glycosyltransferase involved in cell wall biosynthesis
MRISIIGPNTPIPPVGWGAVESLIWDYKLTLSNLGHKVQIINIGDPRKIIDMINEFRPHFVHINYDDWVPLYEYIQYPCAVTTHFAYIERPEMMGPYKQRVFDHFTRIKPNVFGLSDGINDVYQKLCGIPKERLFLNPNGVALDKFKFTMAPGMVGKSIYLAKIDERKRQYLYHDIPNLYFAGNIADSRFKQSSRYLGEWTKEYLHANLTNYGNLVLLSDGEAHPLVCMEAFAAGLGVVVSEWGKSNLDLTKPFIDVISEEKCNDIEYVSKVIDENRKKSWSYREEIRQYAKQFSWENIIKNYYLKNIQKLTEH